MATPKRTFIAYYRVSTKKQGLGLDAQRQICQAFAEANGCTIVAEYSEKESGKEYLAHRAELQRALSACQAGGHTLLVAKVDRLSRDLADGANLVKSHNIEFCDHPNMTALEQGIFFGMAMQEREFISQRTRQALQAKKAAGAILGNRSDVWGQEGRAKSLATRRANTLSNPANRRALLVIDKMQGLTYREIADTLNAAGFTTAKGGQFHPTTVARLRAAAEAEQNAKLGGKSLG